MKKSLKSFSLQNNTKSLSSQAKSALRVIFDGKHSGFWNMAQDEALLMVGEEREDYAFPTLRFFSWIQPTLSIGRFQRTDSLNYSYLKEKGIPLVRRPTGGRAILHDQEITFSLYFPLLRESISPLSLYSFLREAWLKTLREIGLFPDLSNNSTNYLASPYCFSLNTAHEITVGGKKIIGMAQARAKRGVLFQGSFVISAEREKIANCFLNCEKIRQELWSNLITLKELVPKPPEKGEIIRVFLENLVSVLQISWFEGEISEIEIKKSEELFREKYAPSATYHRER